MKIKKFKFKVFIGILFGFLIPFLIFLYLSGVYGDKLIYRFIIKGIIAIYIVSFIRYIFKRYEEGKL